MDNKIPISVTTYNQLIQIVPILKDNNEERKVTLLSFLQDMAKSGVKPNVGTLNAALKCVSTFSIQGTAKELALSLIAEFKTIDIEPCLASYYYILLIFCRPSKYHTNIRILQSIY